MQRRTFVKLWTLAAGTLATGAGCSGREDMAVNDGQSHFPQSIASGDPKPASVILWTRVVDPDAPDEDLELELMVSIDESFAESVTQRVTALADDDGCVRVKVSDLGADQVLFYRFVLDPDGRRLGSRIGQTKTAPAADSDRKVRFAFVSCQDYIGRHYTSYRVLAEQELDFVVHLGDYVYETTGDPAFQDPNSDRTIEFTDKAGAIVFNEGSESEYYAARSLANYRTLYKTVRSDPALQAIHERVPMITIWDDHEFSNDSHGIEGTYFGGEVDESDEQRRKDANRAWSEFMPFEHPDDEEFRYDPAVPFPDDIRIHRDLRFGSNLHLILADSRTFRSDHPVAESAIPGQVAVTEEELLTVLGEIPPEAAPYLDDVATYDGGRYAEAIIAHAAEFELEASEVAGPWSVQWIEENLEELNVGTSPPLVSIDSTGLPLGIAYIDIGKRGRYTSFGARSLVVKPTYDAYAAVRFANSNGESEQVHGPAQEQWLVDTITESDAVWKVWGNEFPLLQRAIDLTMVGGIPDTFTKQFYLTVDTWDGHRNRRDALLQKIAATPNLVAIVGDIHAFAAGTPWTADESEQIVELVTGSISSANFREEMFSIIDTSPALADFAQARLLAEVADEIIGAGPNAMLAYTESTKHGFVVVEAGPDTLEAWFHHIPPEFLSEDYSDRIAQVVNAVELEHFRVQSGSKLLEREFDGEWKTWDPTQRGWV